MNFERINKNIISYLVQYYHAKPTDITPYTRLWKTASGHTYCLKAPDTITRGSLYAVYHRDKQGNKWNFYQNPENHWLTIENECKKFIDKMEKMS